MTSMPFCSRVAWTAAAAMRRRVILLQDEPSAAFPDLGDSEQQLILDDAFISRPVNVECFEREHASMSP